MMKLTAETSLLHTRPANFGTFTNQPQCSLEAIKRLKNPETTYEFQGDVSALLRRIDQTNAEVARSIFGTSS